MTKCIYCGESYPDLDDILAEDGHRLHTDGEYTVVDGAFVDLIMRMDKESILSHIVDKHGDQGKCIGSQTCCCKWFIDKRQVRRKARP